MFRPPPYLWYNVGKTKHMSEEDPHLKKWLTLALVTMLLVLFTPRLAMEAEMEQVCHDYNWDSGTIKAPVMIQTEVSVKVEGPIEPPPSLTSVKYYGNGTCVPYARQRTGVKLYGWAGSFLEKAEEKGYTVTEVPQIGCVMVTSEGGGHVAVVEDITEEGILISEQNYEGLYIVSKRILDPEDESILGYIY